METLSVSVTIMSSSSPLSVFSPKRNFSTRFLRFPIASKRTISSPSLLLHSCICLSNSFIDEICNFDSDNENEDNLHSDSNRTDIVPLLNNSVSISPLSKDAAMGLVLSAATGKGWTTGSGMEGPSVPAGDDTESGTKRISTFPWSLFTKSPRRRMRVAFTCNVCGQRTTRAINPHAYTDGTVFVQCCGCNVFHKLVDNLNLFHDMKCYVSPSFNYRDQRGDVRFNYPDRDDDNDDIFPIL